MADMQRVRETPAEMPAADYFQAKISQGWKLVAMEWERPLEKPQPARTEAFEEVPFGLQVANDCEHLRENPNEKSALIFMMQMIVRDEPLTRIADALNEGGYRNRDGHLWTAGQVFDMLPRLVDVGPRIFTNSEYIARRQSPARV